MLFHPILIGSALAQIFFRATMAVLDHGTHAPLELPSLSIEKGAAHHSEPFWLESIKHQGTAAFNPNPETYQVFRNVK
jgi:hypothetical protein